MLTTLMVKLFLYPAKSGNPGALTTKAESLVELGHLTFLIVFKKKSCQQPRPLDM
ncbi:MAG: hypothetical protein HPY74_19975 [Firmicutes bacterium]|nr:hypothetical protein [Bacillota bacterium]